MAVTAIEHGVRLILKVPEDLDYFQGHFPGAPILAGVVQLDWAMRLASEYLLKAPFHHIQLQVLKFQVVITPGMTLTLDFQHGQGNKFSFIYRSNKGVHASGRVVYER